LAASSPTERARRKRCSALRRRSAVDELADLEARIHILASELELPVRFLQPNPVFARAELTRLALAIVREARLSRCL
jgi:hypothetical protein